MLDDVLGEILVHHGPLRALVRDARVRGDVAARRIQRRWRACRLVPGVRVAWRFREAAPRAWQTGRVAAVGELLCIARATPRASYVFLPHPNVVWRVLK